jgi:toxin ParE1/3/4
VKVAWTRAAEADLEEIADYIRADNPARALSFIQEIVNAGEAIADTPRAFPLIPRLEHKSIRRRTYGQYILLYRVAAEVVEILHVAHGARDYVRSLFPDAS